MVVEGKQKVEGYVILIIIIFAKKRSGNQEDLDLGNVLYVLNVHTELLLDMGCVTSVGTDAADVEAFKRDWFIGIKEVVWPLVRTLSA
jgi:hypothetical protein